MAVVAREAGVSKNTVSLALRGSPRLAAATRERIVAIAERLGYRRNPVVAELMAHLRRTRSPRFEATLALVNANEDARAFQRHPTIPAYVAGCRRRAAQLGYALDEFWLHDPSLSVPRWLSILKARNIRGLLLVGLMDRNRLPAALAPLWDALPAVVTGVRTRGPELSFSCSDHHALALAAFEKAVSLGYRRPALVLDGVIDHLIEGRFTAGFITGQRALLPAAGQVPPFHEVAAARSNPECFRKWLRDGRPDVIFTLYHEVARWLRDLDLRVPEDIGLIQFEWRADHADWAGMDQRNDLVGETALDMLVSMIHNNESGVPDVPRATLIGSRWVDGRTVRAQFPPAAAKTRRRR
jgi:LacI family transcriptional regulator